MTHEWERRCDYMNATQDGGKEFFECSRCHQGRLGEDVRGRLPVPWTTWHGVYRVWDGTDACVPSGQDVFYAPPWLCSHREFQAVVKQRDDYRHLLGELLAIIHRDGGQHTESRGLDASVRDARESILTQRREFESCSHELDRLRRSLGRY